jgi:hypothetical protein
MRSAFHNNKVHRRVQNDNSREQRLLCINIDLISMFPGTQIVDPEHHNFHSLSFVPSLLSRELRKPFLMRQGAIRVRLLMILCALGDFSIHARFDGGGIFDGLFTQYAHHVGLFDFWRRRFDETETDFGLFFFHFCHAALAAEFLLFFYC